MQSVQFYKISSCPSFDLNILSLANYFFMYRPGKWSDVEALITVGDEILYMFLVRYKRLVWIVLLNLFSSKE